MIIKRIFSEARKNWRPWIRMSLLCVQERYLIRSLARRKKSAGVIISSTTFQKRIKSVDHTLRSILAGGVLPEAIYFYCNQETYRALTSRKSTVTRLIEAGFLHLKAVEDYQCFKKLVFALVEHPEKTIVVCDDDVLYPKYWLSSLLEANRKWSDPKVITCHRAHRVSYEEDGRFKPYSSWPQTVKCEPRPTSDLFPTGMGGVLYPPHCLPAIAWDARLFQKYTPSNDDIWFWFCGSSNGCRFALTDRPFNPKKFLEVPGSQASSLHAVNVGQGANDPQLEKCRQFFCTFEKQEGDARANRGD